MKRTTALLLAGLALPFMVRPDGAKAAEGALGVYLLGAKTSMAGFVPPPGTYLADFNYFYTGSTDIDPFNIGGVNIDGGVDADAYVKLFNGLWVAPDKVLGGHVAFSVAVPIGWRSISAEVGIVGGPFGGIQREVDDAHIGDPVLGASLGWHEGNWHWSVGTLLNVPIGYWERGDPTNIGFNRWAADFTGAVTYLDLKTGLELSGAAGFTFNGENDETDYKTGTEFHLEGAVMQHFSKSFALGLQGYLYQQVTGDSGSGALLGDFEGRVLALGPAIDFSFALGQVPVSGNLRYFHEFDVENRLEGDAGYLNFVIPLSGGGH